MNIPFNDLKARHARHEGALREAFERVLASGWFLGGPEVKAFEAAMAELAGQPHGVALANGTDAIALALRGLGLAPGDEVICPALTAPPCWHAILMAGGVPVFADVDPEHLTLDPAAAAAVCGPRTRFVLAVHLYGQPCDLDGIWQLCADKNLILVEDCAQAHGAQWRDKPAGGFGAAAAFSFYPTKNLAALGDAGLAAFAHDEPAARARRLASYGEEPRYVSREPGVNSRMDELQAAMLRAQLPGLSGEIDRRRELAALYGAELAGIADLILPFERPHARHAWHLYPVRTARRDALATHLSAAGIGTAVHYPLPGPAQPMFADSAAAPMRPLMRAAPCPVAEQAASQLLSLPLFPGLGDAQTREVAAAVRAFFAA